MRAIILCFDWDMTAGAASYAQLPGRARYLLWGKIRIKFGQNSQEIKVMASKIVIVTFHDMAAADTALKDVEALQKEKGIELSDAVTVVKDEGGKLKVSETTDFTTGRGAATGSILGLIIGTIVGGPIGGLVLGAAVGALVGKKVDLGVSQDRISAVAESMENSSSAIFLQVDALEEAGVLRAIMDKYNGTVHELELSDEHIAGIDDTLSGMDVRA
jgi:uncharacterized membrane protein